MDFIYSIIGFFVTGGPFMYPILIVFAVGAAIAIERYVTLALVTARNQKAWSQVQPSLMNGDFDAAREVTVEKLGKGPFRVSASKEGYSSAKDSDVAAGRNDVELVLVRHGRVSGRIVTPDGARLAYAFVGRRPPDGWTPRPRSKRGLPVTPVTRRA